MTMKTIIGTVVVAVAIIAGYIGYKLATPTATHYGSFSMLAENYDPYLRANGEFLTALPISTSNLLSTTGTFSVGSTGTALNGIISTTCTGIVYASLSATTSQPIDCAVTGALTTAKAVYLGTPAGAQTGAYTLIISGGHASSTAGYVTGIITNLTGQATTSYPLATTSIPVLVIQ